MHSVRGQVSIVIYFAYHLFWVNGERFVRDVPIMRPDDNRDERVRRWVGRKGPGSVQLAGSLTGVIGHSAGGGRGVWCVRYQLCGGSGWRRF